MQERVPKTQLELIVEPEMDHFVPWTHVHLIVQAIATLSSARVPE